jgi:hypothetical protein
LHETRKKDADITNHVRRRNREPKWRFLPVGSAMAEAAGARRRGRPGGRERRRQNARKPALCQRRMVAGWTSNVASRHAGAMRAASPITKRCHGAHGTRPMIFRCAPMSCCRSSAFSATRYAAAHDVGASPTTNRRTSITWRRTATVSVFTANFVKELKIVGAEVERERRAKVIAAEGEYQAAQRLADAAAIMAKEPISEAVTGVDEPPPPIAVTFTLPCESKGEARTNGRTAENYARRYARV